jgi:hypothetical protein
MSGRARSPLLDGFQCPFCALGVEVRENVGSEKPAVEAVHAEPTCQVFGELDLLEFLRNVVRMRALAASRRTANA